MRLPSALGRCMRDVSAATQHVYVDPTTLADSAARAVDERDGEKHLAKSGPGENVPTLLFGLYDQPRSSKERMLVAVGGSLDLERSV